ncbi:MAG: 16S rRNA (guanine(527)-N(7))-methyltransferase RsmG [Clostridiales bacterium]|nr:16S rRNA (guanine(527)-N(7))-methyltransferase RsmG [Clostridiales bacterium]
MRASVLEMLANWARANGLALTRRQLARLGLYGDLLIEWNRNINLTAITDEREIAVKHFMDSLSIVPYIGDGWRRRGAKILDVGSGAGFPGIPLSIYFQAGDAAAAGAPAFAGEAGGFGAAGSSGATRGSVATGSFGTAGGFGAAGNAVEMGAGEGASDAAAAAGAMGATAFAGKASGFGAAGGFAAPGSPGAAGSLGATRGSGAAGGSGTEGGFGAAAAARAAGALADVTLIDSVGKKVRFLEEVIARLGLERCAAVHARAEDAARQKAHREAYHVVAARALAPMPILLECCLPFLAPGGRLIAMKGQLAHARGELAISKNALRLLGGKLERMAEIRLPPAEQPQPQPLAVVSLPPEPPQSAMPPAAELPQPLSAQPPPKPGSNGLGSAPAAGGAERTLAIFAKVARTPAQYPRKAGTAQKKPL